MTCIIALRDAGKVLIGADTCVTYPDYRDSTDKLFKIGPYTVGAAGDALMMQYVEHGLRFKPPAKQTLLATFAKKVLGPKIAEIWAGLQQLDEDIWGEFVFCSPTEMVSITARGEVFCTSRDYMAIGSGATFALGSLRNSRGKPEDRIVQAINTAAEFLGDVAPPIRMVWA